MSDRTSDAWEVRVLEQVAAWKCPDEMGRRCDSFRTGREPRKMEVYVRNFGQNRTKRARKSKYGRRRI